MKIKKILSVILVLSLVMLAFYGCKSDSTESTTTAINNSAINDTSETEITEAQGAEEDIVQTNTDGSKSIIYANPTVISEDTYYLSGKKIELPMTYSEFSSATGYKFTEQSMAQSPIKPGEYYNALSLTSKEIEGINANVDVPAANLTDSETDVENLSVVGISVYGTDKIDFKLESGLQLGQAVTVNDVIDIYGTPNSATINADGANGSLEYRYSTNTAYHSLAIHIQNGVIYEIQMTIPF